MLLARRLRATPLPGLPSSPDPFLLSPNIGRGSICNSSLSVESTVTRRGRGGGGDTIGRRLLSLIYPKRSAVISIQKWLEEGKSLQKYQLNRVVRELRKHKRFKHALEVCEWMRTQPDFKLLPGDYAVHLDLIAKVRGVESAEKFFNDLPERMKVESTCNSLLHVYVQGKMSIKAELLMQETASKGFLRCCIPYNHMLALYLSNGQLDKVQEVIKELKKHTMPNELTYNLLLSVCLDNVDVRGAEKVMIDMEMYKLTGDWMTYSTLSSIYIKAGLTSKARRALTEMEKRVSRKDRTAYCSLISLYTSLSDIQNALRIWTKMKSIFIKMSNAEYKCILISMVKLGIIGEAESIYNEWESLSVTRSSRISNVLLACYAKCDMEVAVKFHERAMNSGIKPSYSTWEILALGYLRLNKMDKVLHFIKEAFSSVDKWKPNIRFVSAVFEGLEEAGDAEGAELLLVMLRSARYVTTEIYNCLIRTYVKAQKMPVIIAERMKKDKVCMDEETSRLLRLASKFCIASVSGLVSL